MKEYYIVSVKDIIDISKDNYNFLLEMYPDIYKLYMTKEKLLTYEIYDSHQMKKAINILNDKIEQALAINNLPEYLVFEETEEFFKVKELFSKEEIYLCGSTIENSRVTSSERSYLSKLLNSYTPLEIIQVYNVFPAFSQKNKKRKIISFPK